MLTSFVSLKGLQGLKKIGIIQLRLEDDLSEKLLDQQENLPVLDQQIGQMGGEFFRG